MNTSPLRRVAQLGLLAAIGLVTPALTVSPAHAAPPSASASITDRTLNIIGSNAGDNIVLSVASPNLLNVDFGNDGTIDQQFDRNTFDSLNVSLGNGNDHFTATGVTVPLSSTIDGGNGDDVIIGTGSPDVITAGNGNDFVAGGLGHDVASLDNGDDIFRWDPGEGSDDVDGGNGHDALLFNGNNAPIENESLSAAGSRAVFSRVQGNVTMNLDAVEQLDLHTFGGADNVTVNDLTGTSLRQANIDLSLAGNGGASDGAADVVTVNGTSSGDHVDVVGQGTTVDVAGLQPRVDISGSNGAEPDRLQVNTLDGNDAVHVDASAQALISVTPDLGPGQI